jgi:hypothetical protein
VFFDAMPAIKSEALNNDVLNMAKALAGETAAANPARPEQLNT